jgi:hypothetical protein
MDKLIDRFLAWPLPDSVCPDACTINKRAHGAPIPTGTNLLSAIEARQMLEHVLADTIQIPLAEYEKLKADAERLDYLDTLTKRRLRIGRKLWPIASDMHFGASGVALYVRTGIGSKTETQGVGNTVRAAIDAAYSMR